VTPSLDDVYDLLDLEFVVEVFPEEMCAIKNSYSLFEFVANPPLLKD
jgi:hypothetical protein